METTAIEKLHEELLTYWNNQNASGMASLFTKDANVIGFDGSQMNGQVQIETELKQVFANHKTASYVWKIEEIRFLGLTDCIIESNCWHGSTRQKRNKLSNKCCPIFNWYKTK